MTEDQKIILQWLKMGERIRINHYSLDSPKELTLEGLLVPVPPEDFQYLHDGGYLRRSTDGWSWYISDAGMAALTHA